jgi:hypothetical protein
MDLAGGLPSSPETPLGCKNLRLLRGRPGAKTGSLETLGKNVPEEGKR